MIKTRYQSITEDIEQAIDNGELKPGDRISSIREISEQYKVSQITAMRVFKELVGSGKIIRRDGTGYYVAEPRRLQTGDTIFCAFRPPHPENKADNFGNRIYEGLLNECLESRFNIFQPRSIINLRGREPDEDGVKELADDLMKAGNIAGLLLDMRFSDDMIRRHILPVSGDTPIAIIGRKSTLPLISTSVPMENCGRDAARLALKVRATEFAILDCPAVRDADNMCRAFGKELLNHHIKANNILNINDILQTFQRDREIFRELEEAIAKASGRLLIFCSSDHFSRALCDYLSERGKKAGKDYSLISFGGLECALTGSPPITTIAFDMQKLGRLAVQALLRRETLPRLNYEVDYRIEISDTL